MFYYILEINGKVAAKVSGFQGCIKDIIAKGIELGGGTIKAVGKETFDKTEISKEYV
jgi:hypothetical protein